MRVVHVLRKPLSEGTVAANTLKHGCGGLHIAVSRISTEDNLNGGAYAINPTHRAGEDMWTRDRKGDTNCFKRGGAGRSSLPGDTREGASAGMFQPSSTAPSNFVQPTGRWPGNLILQHLDGCRCDGIKKVKGIGGGDHSGTTETHEQVGGFGYDRHNITRHNDADGKETVANWICEPGCPVARLDEQSGVLKSGAMDSVATGGQYTTYGKMYERRVTNPASEGGASRFYKQIGGNTDG